MERLYYGDMTHTQRNETCGHHRFSSSNGHLSKRARCGILTTVIALTTACGSSNTSADDTAAWWNDFAGWMIQLTESASGDITSQDREGEGTTAASSTQTESGLDEDGDSDTQIVRIDAVTAAVKDSRPKAVALVLRGDRPSPCHMMNIWRSSEDRIHHITITAVLPPDTDTTDCDGATEPFAKTVILGHDFEDELYTVIINDTAYDLDLSRGFGQAS